MIDAANDSRPPEPEGKDAPVLIVDDERWLAAGIAKLLSREGIAAQAVPSAEKALESLQRTSFGLVISDIDMPGMSGIQLLEKIRAADDAIPVIFITGVPDAASAERAVELGAYKYLTKPFDPATLIAAARRALNLHQLAEARRGVEALDFSSDDTMPTIPGIADDDSVEEALKTISVAFQPIVEGEPGFELYGFEALLRCAHPKWKRPDKLIDAVCRHGKLEALERRIRALATGRLRDSSVTIFLNIHPTNLGDPELYDPSSKITACAERIVLEITETAPLEEIEDLPKTIERLRAVGYRIALDDLGAGFASLNSLFRLEPDIVKLDMGMIRDIHQDQKKCDMISAVVHACRRMGLQVVAEGIENADEFVTTSSLGCDLFQGYWIARPDPVPKPPNMPMFH